MQAIGKSDPGIERHSMRSDIAITLIARGARPATGIWEAVGSLSIQAPKFCAALRSRGPGYGRPVAGCIAYRCSYLLVSRLLM